MQRLCTETSRFYLGRPDQQAIADVSQKQWGSLLNRMILALRQAAGRRRANRQRAKRRPWRDGEQSPA